MYQKLLNAFINKTQFGKTPVKLGLKYAIVTSWMIGTIKPARVITLGANQSGYRLLAMKFQNGLNI
jgi:hypothetical protein